MEQVKALPSSHPARQLSSVWSRLSLLDEDRPSATVVLVDGDKIYPPVSARSDILRRLHLDHSGVVKARRKASSRFYWPGLSEAVAQQCRECHACRETERAAPADPPLLPSRVQASYPMHRIAVDVLSYGGKCWLIGVDMYSGFPLVKDMGKKQDTQTYRYEKIRYKNKCPRSGPALSASGHTFAGSPHKGRARPNIQP